MNDSYWRGGGEASGGEGGSGLPPQALAHPIYRESGHDLCDNCEPRVFDREACVEGVGRGAELPHRQRRSPVGKLGREEHTSVGDNRGVLDSTKGKGKNNEVRASRRPELSHTHGHNSGVRAGVGEAHRDPRIPEAV